MSDPTIVSSVILTGAEYERLTARVKALEEGLTATRRTLTGVVNNLDDPHYRGHIPEGGDYTYVAHEENAHERWVQWLSDAARAIDALLTPAPAEGGK